MLGYEHIKEAVRMLIRARRVAKKGFKRHYGNAEEIAEKIIKGCFNGSYFQVSTGHFCEFYMRDFGFCVEHLAKLGYYSELKKSLEYAMHCYAVNNRLTTTITPSNKPIDVFYYSPDSLPLLLYSLRHARCAELAEIYKPFLNNEIRKYFSQILDKESLLITKNKKLSSIKDSTMRKGSCYNNAMMLMLADELEYFPYLDNPFKALKEKMADSFIKKFWSGSFFYDSIEDAEKKQKKVCGDANIFPFWCGVIKEKSYLKKAIGAIKEQGLDKPFPLKYSTSQKNDELIFLLRLILSSYESNTIWAHLGMCYLDVLYRNRKHYRKELKEAVSSYKKLIEQHKTFLELYEPDGSVYKKPHYAADEGMIWCSVFLSISKRVL